MKQKLTYQASLTINNPQHQGRLVAPPRPPWYWRVLWWLEFHSPLAIVALCIAVLYKLGLM